MPSSAASWTRELCDQARRESERLIALCDSDRARFAPRLELETDHLDPEHRSGMDDVIRKIEPISDLSAVLRPNGPARGGGPAPPAPSSTGRSGLFEDKLNLKLPGGSPYPWHQDWPCCWRAHTDELATCFVYLDDADLANGCLQVDTRAATATGTIYPFRAPATSRWTRRPSTRTRLSRSLSRPAT